jgi:hypothetical protein
MPVNSEEIAFLDYFCDDALKFDYAILIDAPWGAGKTHFIRDYLKKRDEKAKLDTSSPGFLFVSLYGLKDATQVRDALFAQAHPLVSSKAARLTGTAVADVLKKFTGVELSKKLELADIFPDIAAKIVVFDDLERSGMTLADSLGLINSFVDAGDFKVIVITNQQKICTDNESFGDRKEKVFGRTLTVMSDPAEVLDKFIDNMQCPPAKAAVRKHRDAVLRVFAASNYHNLRSLRAALDDFDRLVLKLDPILQEAPQALRDLLTYVIAVGVEVRAGSVSPEKVQDIQSYISFSRNVEPETTRLGDIANKYIEVNWQAPIVPPAILGKLIATGVLPIDEVNEVLREHPTVVGPKAVPHWRAMWDWARLDKAKYAECRVGLLTDLEMHKLTHPGEILHVLGEFIVLETYGDSLVSSITTTFKAYIDELVEAKSLIPDISIFDKFHADGWHNLEYQKKDEPAFKDVLQHLQVAVQKSLAEKIKGDALKLVDKLKNDSEAASVLYEYGINNGKFGGVPMLHHIPVSDFADALVKDDRYNIILMGALRQRYERGRGDTQLVSEKTWLFKLEAEIKARAAQAAAPFSKLLATHTDSLFAKVTESLRMNRREDILDA